MLYVKTEVFCCIFVITNNQKNTIMKAQELEQAVNNSTDMFLLAAKECGFTTPEEIENNFEIIALVAGEMVKHSKERIITKLNTNPMWLKYLAAKYYKRVNG